MRSSFPAECQLGSLNRTQTCCLAFYDRITIIIIVTIMTIMTIVIVIIATLILLGR